MAESITVRDPAEIVNLILSQICSTLHHVRVFRVLAMSEQASYMPSGIFPEEQDYHHIEITKGSGLATSSPREKPVDDNGISTDEHKALPSERVTSPPLNLEEDNYNRSTLLVHHIQDLMASTAASDEGSVRGLELASRQTRRLVHKSWPAFTGGLIWFSNSANSFNQLPVDVVLELLTFLPHLEVLKLSLCAQAFAVPQPVLKGTQSLSRAAIDRIDLPSMRLSREDPKNIWLRCAPGLQMVRCLVVREPRSFLGGFEFSLYVQDFTRGNEILLLMATRTLNGFNIFNVSRGYQRGRLRKGSGNFVGSLVSDALRIDHVILDATGTAELGALSYRRRGEHFSSTWFEGPQPRKCFFSLPLLDKARCPVKVNAPRPGSAASGLLHPLRQHLKLGTDTPSNSFIVKTRDPVFDNQTSSYRLNFHGRVTVPSIKNLQIVHEDDPTETLCQFGKTSQHRFHLDFKRPFNALQAFCVALSSFSHH